MVNTGGSSKLIGITVFPLSDYFDGASPAHQHELGHQWINFANSSTSNGSPHWPASTMAADIMGLSIPGSGGRWQFRLQAHAGGQRAAYRCAELLTGDELQPARSLPDVGLMPASKCPIRWVVTDSNFGANWATLCDGRLLTSGFTRLTVNDVIAANGTRSPAYIVAAHLPGGDGGGVRWPAVGRCDGVLQLLRTAHGKRERLPMHGFSKQARRTVLRRHRRTRCADRHGRHRGGGANRLTVVEYFHAGLNYSLHDLARQRKGVAGWRSGLGAHGVTFPMLAYPEPAVSGNVRFTSTRSPRAAPTRQPLLYDQYGGRHGAYALNPTNAAIAQSRRTKVWTASLIVRMAVASAPPAPPGRCRCIACSAATQIPGRSEPSLHHITCGGKPVCGAELGWRGRGVLRAGELIRGLFAKFRNAKWRNPNSRSAKGRKTPHVDL